MEPTHNPNQNAKDEVRYWPRNQVVLTFVTSLDSREPANSKENIINQLPFDQVNELLAKPTKEGQKSLALRNFGPDDVPRKGGGLSLSIGPSDKSLNDPVGKHLFPLQDGQQSVITASFHIDDLSSKKGEGPEPDNTIEAIERINEGRSQCMTENVLSLSAVPNWYVSCTGDVTHGCPITPPVPFDGSTVCQSDPGDYPITVPHLSEELQSKDGEGVTVFVLDTFPKPDEVVYPALEKVRSGGNNLLVDVADNMGKLESPFTSESMATDMAKLPAINYCYQDLPRYDHIEIKDQPKTGKDIDGDLVGYPMADHGLFVAGIIRTLARQATIICIRVLNDFGVGDIHDLHHVLENIVKYVQQEKNRHGQNYCPRFVVNMSSVATPYDEELPGLGMSGELKEISREGLRKPLESLAGLGVIVVAAAGNDSDPRKPMPGMGKHGMHLDSRYPAAFEDTFPQVISVGSVDKNGRAAKYSNCPGDFGVATYGGGILERDTSDPVHGRTQALRPDALLGLYTTPYYPTLSKNDTTTSGKAPANLRYPTQDAPTNSKAWAYWAGTSFSTPIITALTARILQTISSPGVDVRQKVIDLAGTNTAVWSGHHAAVPVIRAEQCGN